MLCGQWQLHTIKPTAFSYLTKYIDTVYGGEPGPRESMERRVEGPANNVRRPQGVGLVVVVACTDTVTSQNWLPAAMPNMRGRRTLSAGVYPASTSNAGMSCHWQSPASRGEHLALSHGPS